MYPPYVDQDKSVAPDKVNHEKNFQIAIYLVRKEYATLNTYQVCQNSISLLFLGSSSL